MTSDRPVDHSNQYLSKTRAWFDSRYQFASDGMYFPHQPVYGFSLWGEHLMTNLRAYMILKFLEGRTFSSFIDVGCAEGYLPHLVRHFFKARVSGSDFSVRGLEKARRFYHLPCAAADAHHLPFANRSFDVVTCCEVIEHVADPRRVIDELTRICNQWLIITTPATRTAAQRDQQKQEEDPNLLFGHVNYFLPDELRSWLGPQAILSGFVHRRIEPLYRRICNGPELARTLSDLCQFVFNSCPEMAADTRHKFQQQVAQIAARKRGVLDLITGPHLVKLLFRLDRWLSRRQPEQTAQYLVIKPCHAQTSTQSSGRLPRLLDYLLVDHGRHWRSTARKAS